MIPADLVEGDEIRGTIAIPFEGAITRRWTDDRDVEWVAFVDRGSGERVVRADRLHDVERLGASS